MKSHYSGISRSMGMGGLSSDTRTMASSSSLPPVFVDDTQPANSSVVYSLAITTTDPSPLIDWGDGTVEAYTSGVAKTHTYATADGSKKFKIRIYRPALVTKIVDANTLGVRRGTLTLTQFPELTELRIRQWGCTGPIILSGNPKLTTLYLSTNAFTGQLVLSAQSALQYLGISSNLFSSTLGLNACPELLQVEAINCGTITAISVLNCVKMTLLYAYSNANLAAISGSASLVKATNVRVYSCSLLAATINALLIALDNAGLSSGYIDYKAQTGDGHLDGNRSPAAATAITNLEGRSWSVVRA